MKKDLYKSEWMVANEWESRACEFIPVAYKTPHTTKYSEKWYTIRYIKKKDLDEYFKENNCI